jgi:hypothetical protein
MSFPKTHGLERVRETFSTELLKINEKIEKLEDRRTEVEYYLRQLDNGIDIVRRVEQLDLPLDPPKPKGAPECDHNWVAKTEKAQTDEGEIDRAYWHCQTCLKVVYDDPTVDDEADTDDQDHEQLELLDIDTPPDDERPALTAIEGGAAPRDDAESADRDLPEMTDALSATA